MKRVIYVQWANDGNDKYLVAWDNAESCENGHVGVYALQDEYDKREVTELRRKGTKTWVKVGK